MCGLTTQLRITVLCATAALLAATFMSQSAVQAAVPPTVAIDGMLANQIEMDMESLTMATGRTFSDDQKEEIRTHQRRAYRWTFLVSGLEHPNFVRLVDELTNGGGHKIAGAARALAA